MRWDLSNENDLKEIEKRISASFYKLTKRSEGFEDCVQEVITRMLEGRHKHATIDQAVIDYLREFRNLKGFRRNFKGENYPIANSYEQGNFDRTIGSSSRGDVGDRIDFNRIIGMSRHWERAVMTLYFREEYGQAEIGDFFGVSESRVHQWIERIQKRIQQRIASTKSTMERKISNVKSTTLQEETRRIEWRVESFEDFSMAKSQSGSLASFDEKSF